MKLQNPIIDVNADCRAMAPSSMPSFFSTFTHVDMSVPHSAICASTDVDTWFSASFGGRFRLESFMRLLWEAGASSEHEAYHLTI